MSGKVKHRSAANTSEAATTSVNERILRRCHSLYTDQENGMYLYIRITLGFRQSESIYTFNILSFYHLDY